MASEPPKVDAGAVEPGQRSSQQEENAQSEKPIDPNQSAAAVPNAASASGDNAPPPQWNSPRLQHNVSYKKDSKQGN